MANALTSLVGAFFWGIKQVFHISTGPNVEKKAAMVDSP